MLKKSKKIIWLILIFFNSNLFSEKKSIKTFHVFNSFGTQTKELRNSIILTYDKYGFLKDSTIYTHNIPLNKKYVYVTGPKEGLKLEREYDKEKVLSYQFENDSLGNRIETTLFGSKDSIFWKEYTKYDDNGIKIKRIRYNPLKALNPEMMPKKENYTELLWGEIYEYDTSGTILEKKELYNNYILEITKFKIDSLKNYHKTNEYFDPSVIFRTIYFHNEENQLIKEISVGKHGTSIGSKSYEYDILGRKIKIISYNTDGQIDETINFIYDDNNYKIFEYYLDSASDIFLKKETLLNSNGAPYIEAFLDNKNRVLEKNVFYYDKKGRINQVKQYDMIRQKQYDNMQIPIRVSIYEY